METVKDERSPSAAPAAPAYALALAPAAGPGNDAGAAAPALEFGWVPAPVVRALLEEVGNFRARAEAIELLHAAVLDVGRVPGPWPPGTVLPTLSAFLAFLLRLVGDPNFKIAISAMTILEDLVGPLGADVRPYLGTVMPPLIERMGDNVQMVRQAAVHAVGAMARSVGPSPVLAALGGALVHSSWRVREEGVNAYTAALLSHAKERFDYPTCVRALAGAAADKEARVATAALEAFALLHQRLGALLQGLLTAVGAAEPVKRAVAERIQKAPQLGLPVLDSQGNVQHQPHARPPSAQPAKPAAALAAPRLLQTKSLPAVTPGAAVLLSTTSSLPSAATHQALTGSSPTPAPPVAAAALDPATAPEPSSPSTLLSAQRAQQQLLQDLYARSPAAVAAAAVSGVVGAFSPGAAFPASSAASMTASPSGTASSAAGLGTYACTAEAGLPAALVESSAPSCTSQASCEAGLGGDVGSPQGVERSQGSLLNWQRPMHRANQPSFPGSPGAVRAASSSKPGSSPLTAGLAGMGRADAQPPSIAGLTGMGRADAQRPLSTSGSAPPPAFVRRKKPQSPPAGLSLGTLPSALPSALPGALPSTLPSALPSTFPSVLPAALPAAAAAPSGTAGRDLLGSVRAWQQRRQGSASPALGECDYGSAGSSTWSASVMQQQGRTAPDDSLGVEPRSDSLLQWRLPVKRGPAGQQAALGAATATPAAAPALPGSPQPVPARTGSASLKHSLGSFTKRLWSGKVGEAMPAGQQGVADATQPGSPKWSIGAVRQEEQAQPALQPLVQERNWPAKPCLTVTVPEPTACQPGSCEQQGQQQQQPVPAPESPSKGAARLSRLKQMTERRRVWSAPSTGPHHQEQPDGGAAAEPLDSVAAAMGSPVGTQVQGVPGTLPAEAGAAADSSEGGPGTRPGLQALKSRARTARILSTTSTFLGPPSTAGGTDSSYQPYSMEAVNEIFGPDQPVGGSLATAGGSCGSGMWSPARAASGSIAGLGGTSQPKLSVLVRSGPNGSMQWPDSPTCAATSPSGRTSWRGSGTGTGLLDTIPGSPKALSTAAAALADGSATGGFCPAADTTPLAQPEAALQQAIAALQAAAVSEKKELDWQAQFEALRTIRRVALHHPSVLASVPTLHLLVGLAAPVIDALRSTLSRLAIAVFQGLAETLGPALDAELDAFVPLLLKRAGQISISGRDNFLAVEADRALAAVVANSGEARSAAALLNCLASKSPDVRAKAAMHLDACLGQHGDRLVPALPGGSGSFSSGTGGGAGAAMVPRLLRAAVGLLDEGGLEARTAGKRMLFELRRLLDAAAASSGGAADDFRRALARLDCKTDKVWEVLESGRMPSAPARLPSASLRPPSGSGPPSPTAGSYSPTKPGILAAMGSGVVSMPRTSSASSSLGNTLASAAISRAPSANLGQRSGSISSTSGKMQPPSRSGSLVGGAASAGGRGSFADGAGSGNAGAAAGTAPIRRGSRPGSAGLAGPAPAGSLAGVDANLQQELEAASSQMDSQEWKARLEGLEALEAAVGGNGQAGALPPEAQLWLANALSQRVVDANLKVQQQALKVLSIVLESTGAGMAPSAPALVPAICKCLDSGNPSVRQAAAGALDSLLRDWAPDACLPLLMASLGSPQGTARSKEMLLERVGTLAPALWQARPALVRQHVLPALFSLLAAGKRPELRQMAQGPLVALAQQMGQELATAAASSPLLAPAQQQMVADVVAGAGPA